MVVVKVKIKINIFVKNVCFAHYDRKGGRHYPDRVRMIINGGLKNTGQFNLENKKVGFELR